jgi:hypothetical protein
MSEKQKTKQELPNRAHSHTVKNKSKAKKKNQVKEAALFEAPGQTCSFSQ